MRFLKNALCWFKSRLNIAEETISEKNIAIQTIKTQETAFKTVKSTSEPWGNFKHPL
jgi:hypothetical protein